MRVSACAKAPMLLLDKGAVDAAVKGALEACLGISRR